MKAADLFEKLIWNTRLLILFAVIAGIVATLIMIVLGSVSVLWDISHFLKIFTASASDAQFEGVEKTLTINVVSAMDAFLIATILYIFSIGLYELFIRKIKTTKEQENSELIVTSLDQLKEKLIKVILIVLVVTFFKCAITLHYGSVQDLLYFSISLLFVAGALFLTQFKIKKDPKSDTH